jgi:hypothetical protein
MSLMPVTLPPGRLKLATRPYRTGSLPVLKTIGMVAVAALAARAAESPVAAMTVTRRPTRSAANSLSRSAPALLAKRYSIATSRPWIKPVSPNPLRKLMSAPGAPTLRNPTTGSAGCCARAASGHAAAPSPAMNSRRLTMSQSTVAPEGANLSEPEKLAHFPVCAMVKLRGLRQPECLLLAHG